MSGAGNDRQMGPGWAAPGCFAVAHGVYRIPCPLPEDGLVAVNVYAIQAGDGLALVDTGWRHPRTVDALERGLLELGATFADVHTILCTHAHYDHYGLAPYVRDRSGGTVTLGAREMENLEVANDRPMFERSLRHRQRWMTAHGAEELLAEMAKGHGDDFDAVRAMGSWDRPTRLVRDGDIVMVGGRALEVIATPGHTRGHVMYLDEGGGLLFAGDHVLPHITPSLGFEPFEDGRALERYLASLAVARGLEVDLVLPGHGPPFAALAERVDQLLDHHDERLRSCIARLQDDGPDTTLNVARGLPWTRHARSFDDLDTLNRMLAVQETATHLELLLDRGRLQRNGSTPWRYAITA